MEPHRPPIPPAGTPDPEVALRRAEMLSSVLDSVPLLISYVDADGRYRFVNGAYETWFGISRAAMEGRKVREVVHPRTWEQVGARVEAALAGAEGHFEGSIPHPDGSTRWIRASFLPHRRPDGTLAGYVGLIIDLTERRRMEEALLEKEGFLESIYNGVEECIFVVDLAPDGRYLLTGFNPAYLRRFRSWGVDMQRFLGKSTLDLRAAFPEELVASVEAKYAECARSEGPIQFEDVVPAEGRQAYWLTHLSPLRDGEGRTYRLVGTSVDITRQKEDAERIRQAEEQLRQGQKMEAVGRLAGGIAHDFNNLLSAIIGLSDLAAARIDDRDAVLGMLAEIRESGERAARLTSQLLAFSRKQILSPRIIDLNAVVSGMDALLRRVIGEDLELRTYLAPGLPPVRLDPGQLEQIVLNLAVNARDAMPAGGRLLLETSLERAPSGREGESGGDPAPHVVLSVGDTGVGMQPEVKARIFEPFFTTKGPGQGTGMGLATVYGIVQQSGGQIEVDSEPGRGATFRIRFPAAAGSPEPERPAGGGVARGSGETILLVEDEDVVRDYARRALEGLGYRVLAARNGDAALESAAREGSPIRLLLTDVVMPGMGGRDLWERVKALRPEARVIFMTGYTESAIVHRGELDADAPFLPKPFSPSQLAAKVGEALAGPGAGRTPAGAGGP